MPDESRSESSGGHRYREPSRPFCPLTVISLIVAIGALALAGWTLYRLDNSNPSYSDTQRADAKATVCAAMGIVRKGVSLNTNMQPPGGPTDVTGSLAVAANARVALYDGGQYLLSKLDSATPEELADAVRNFANDLMDIGAAATAGAQNSEPEQAARLKEADASNATITQLRK
jgi:hypothetical protein